jgi:hypothetical protein
MSASWTVTSHGFDDDEPGPLHDLRCPVLTDPGPVLDPFEDCDCRGRSTERHLYLPMPEKRLLTTAERLDLLLPCDEQAS